MERCSDNILARCKLVYSVTLTGARGTVEDLLERYCTLRVLFCRSSASRRSFKRLPFSRFEKQVQTILICQSFYYSPYQTTRSVNCICDIKHRRIGKIIRTLYILSTTPKLVIPKEFYQKLFVCTIIGFKKMLCFFLTNLFSFLVLWNAFIIFTWMASFIHIIRETKIF